MANDSSEIAESQRSDFFVTKRSWVNSQLENRVIRVMKIIIAGAMSWKERRSIREELEPLSRDTIVIFGDAPGADALGGEVAKELGFPVKPMAKNAEDYRQYKKGAWKGLNERMIARGPELILAFHPAVEKSRGTKHLLKLAHEAGIPYRVIAE